MCEFVLNGILRGSKLNAAYDAMREAGAERVAAYHGRIYNAAGECVGTYTERLFLLPDGRYIFYHSGDENTRYAVIEQCENSSFGSLFWRDGHFMAAATAADAHYWVSETFTAAAAIKTFQNHNALPVLRRLVPEFFTNN